MSPIYFIIPAAGVGSRMQTDIPKQYLILDEETILHRTLNIFLASSYITKGVVGVAQNDLYYRDLDVKNLIKSEGGATRSETVYKALQRLKVNEKNIDDAWIIVHDAARPGLSVDELDQFIKRVLESNNSAGGIMALPAQDTIKQVDDLQKIELTLNRDRIWLAQTPQMCRFSILVESLEYCLKNNINVTDEASVLEYNGYFPTVYQGFTHNFKITYPSDLELMRLYLQARKRCE